MIDKEIIIDGVDVSGCDFLAKEDIYCSYSGEYTAYKGQCGCSDEEMCKNNPKCFYKKILKQFQCKEQELRKLKNNEDFLITALQQLWGKQIAEEQSDCKNLNYSKPITNGIYNKITEFERTLKDVAFAQSIKMGKTKSLGETGSPRSYRRWEKREQMLLEREFLK